MAGVVVPTVAVLAQVDNGIQINTDAGNFDIPGDAANEPSFAISPVDSDIMITGWRQFDTINSDVRFAGYAYSHDGGQTWMNAGPLDAPPFSGSNANQSDPVLAVNLSGSFYYNSLIFRSNKDGQVVYGSDDGGLTWGTPSYITLGFADKNWYAIDQSGVSDHHYCIWGNTDIWFTRSIDGGVSWPNAGAINDFSDGFNLFSQVATGPDGELYAGFLNYSADYVGIRRSDNASDPGQTPTFGPIAKLNDFGAMIFGPAVNPDGGGSQVNIGINHSDSSSRGDVYVLVSTEFANDPGDVMFARSTDGGATFSPAMRINDDPTGNNAYQWMAAMSVAPSGRIDAIWYDTREDPVTLHSRLYYSYSYDGGLSWSENRPITDPFDTSIGWPVQRKIGDYFQCQSDNGGVRLVYAATFNGGQDVYYLRTHPMQLNATDLIRGEDSTFTSTGGEAGEWTYLAYSTTGIGRTEIPNMNILVDLDTPIQAGSRVLADGSGTASWVLPVPAGAPIGMDIWVQATQGGAASEVVTLEVQ